MRIAYLTFDWGFYFGMLAAITFWLCGVNSITGNGMIFGWLREWFDRKRKVRNYFSDERNQAVDREILVSLSPDATYKDYYIGVEKSMAFQNVFSDWDTDTIMENLSDFPLGEEARKVELCNTRNRYYNFEEENVIPRWIKMPVITCITCMASVHSLLIYYAVVHVGGLRWNWILWAMLAVSAAFTGTFMWRLKEKISK